MLSLRGATEQSLELRQRRVNPSNGRREAVIIDAEEEPAFSQWTRPGSVLVYQPILLKTANGRQ
jgi:hypothetical protein